MSPREHDPELRDLISAGDTLHEQLARFDRSEPPEELDRIVIERARQAIRMPESERPIRQVRWAVPLAVAATLLISFALVVQQVGPQPPAPSPPTAATEADSTDAYAPVAVQARVEETRADEAAELRRSETAKVPAVTTSPPATVPPAARRRSSTPAAGATSAAARAAESVETGATAHVEPSAALAKREVFDSVAKAGSAESAANAPADSAQRTDALAGRAKAEATSDFRSDPDAWMAQIRRLRHVGRSDDADRELAEFRKTFPHYKYAAPAEPPVERPADAIAPEK